MTMTLSGTSGVTYPSGTNAQQAPSKVLQVVSSNYGTYTNTSSTTAVDTGLTVSITPLFSTSKIFVVVNIGSVYVNTTSISGVFTLVRGSTTLQIFENNIGYNTSVGSTGGTTGTNYLDSPATTSATIYKVQFYRSGASGAVYINNNNPNSYSNITVMEIAA